MGDGPLIIRHPLLNNDRSVCRQFEIKGPLCTSSVQGRHSTAVDASSYALDASDPLSIKLDPKFNMLITSLAAHKPRTTQLHWGWRLAIQFAKLVKAMDINIRGMAMNGLKAGCHFPEAYPKGKPNPGCNTHYKAGTRANARLEIRQVAGQDISRAYRFFVYYNKPLLHMYKGWLPVENDGIYAEIGPNWNAKGPLSKNNCLGPFGCEGSEAVDRRFRIPLRGKIPQSWARRKGHIVYALRYPFNIKRRYTARFQGVWGMTDRKVFRQLGIPPGTFPTDLPGILTVLSMIDTRRATHVNFNKPYRVTGQKPHIEWADLHDADATALLRDGIIDVPKIGRMVFNRAKYLKEENLDRHPKLLAIVREWKKYRDGTTAEAKRRTRELATEYYRQRKLITNSVHRIEITWTATNATITIHNPAISDIEMPLGTARAKAEGLTIGTIRIVTPPVLDLRYGRRKLSEARVTIEGLSAQKLEIRDPANGIMIKAKDCRIGSIVYKGGSLSLTGISMDIQEGRIGGVTFGGVNVGEGSIGRGTLRRGSVNVVYRNGASRADIEGLVDVTIRRIAGSKLTLNVPGLEVSGALRDIRISGPARFVLTPRSWEVNRGIRGGSTAQRLSLTAKIENAEMVHNPTPDDLKRGGKPPPRVINTRMRLRTADLAARDIRRLAFHIARAPTEKSRFTHVEINDVSVTNIAGSGRSWTKGALWLAYLSANFKRLMGSIRVRSVSVRQNGRGSRAGFKGIDLDLRYVDTEDKQRSCSIRGDASVSPNSYRLNTKVNCLFKAPGRGNYIHIKSKGRPLKHRRPFK